MWVDNIRKVREKSLLDTLDEKLVSDVKRKQPKFTITIPEIMKWDEVHGFSFTRSKSDISPVIDSENYLKHLDKAGLSIESLKRDRLFVFDIHENEFEYPIYRSIYFEHKDKKKTYIIFSGVWYEIDNDFLKRINDTLKLIEVSDLVFPTVYTTTEMKKGKPKEKIETEGDYNERAAAECSYHLLDKKLIKSKRTTTSIELCDLLTNKKQFIHVKHRKGGSAGLSHLFAQGAVAAQIMLGDKEFRKAARVVLKRVKNGAQDIVPLEKFVSEGVEIVYLILGEEANTIKENLPFFSKVNLTKAFEDLSQRGFTVTISGAGKEQNPNA